MVLRFPCLTSQLQRRPLYHSSQKLEDEVTEGRLMIGDSEGVRSENAPGVVTSKVKWKVRQNERDPVAAAAR